MEGACEGNMTTSQVLLPTKWNEEREGGWRMDVNVDNDDSDGDLGSSVDGEEH